MKKRFFSTLLALAMTCIMAFPAIAAEPDQDAADVLVLSDLEIQTETALVTFEDSSETQTEEPADNVGESQQENVAEDDSSVGDDRSQETGDGEPEEKIDETQDEDVIEDELSLGAEIPDETISEDELTEEDIIELEDEPEDDNEIVTLAVTNGFGQGSDGAWYYYKNGQIDTSVNSVIKDTEKRIDGTASWWYVVGGKVQTGFTGLADYKNEYGWYYINNGKVTFDFTGLAQNKNGLFYVENSKVDFNYNGFANDGSSWWYVGGGKVNYDKNSVIKDTGKKINGSSDWWYVLGSKVQTSFTGLADYRNDNGWWYIENGRVTFSKETVAKNKNGWFYVKDSKVQFSYNGFADNSNGWWYIEKGKVTFNKNSVIKDTNKKVDGTSSWWYVVDSKVQTGFTGLADYKNENGWYYISNGKVTFDFNGYAQNKNGWYHIVNSKVDFSQCGVIKAIINGIYDWWYIDGGKVMMDYTGVANYKNENGWWYIKNGRVDFTYTGVAKNKNGWWYVNGGKVIFDDVMKYAAEYVGANSTSSKSSYDRLVECFNYMVKHRNYSRTYGTPTAFDLPSYALDYFKQNKGSCYSYAVAFAYIAKALGYETRVDVGRVVSVDGNGSSVHGWTEVKIDGTWYIWDVYYDSYMKNMSNFPRELISGTKYTLKLSNGNFTWE